MATQVQAVIAKHLSLNAVHTSHPKEEMSQLLVNALLWTSIAAICRDQCYKAAEYLTGALTIYPKLTDRMDSYYR